MMEQDPRIQAFRELLETIDTLRAPGGCSWDRKQTVPTMAPMILEEAFEVADAIATQDNEEIAEELGDLLMNVLLTSRIAQDDGDFSLLEVSRGIREKLIRRHPHVFGDLQTENVNEILSNWEAIKRQEREEKSARKGGVVDSTLAGIPRSLPALLLALRMGEKAARTGFDWPDRQGPMDKVHEEVGELKEAIDGGTKEEAEQELGDVLFAAVNVARHLGVDPEAALRKTCQRFSSRFAHIENTLGDKLTQTDLERMEELWSEAKRIEKRGESQK